MVKRMNIIIEGESEKIIGNIPKKFRCGFIREAIIFYAVSLGINVDEDIKSKIRISHIYLKNKYKDMVL